MRFAEEIHPDDLEPGPDCDDLLDAVCDAVDEGAAEEELEEPLDSEKRDFICEIFPFARPSKFYDSLFQLPSVLKVDTLVLLASTGHPSGWIAARRACVKVSCVKAREAIHSMRPFFRQWAQSPSRQGP